MCLHLLVYLLFFSILIFISILIFFMCLVFHTSSWRNAICFSWWFMCHLLLARVLMVRAQGAISLMIHHSKFSFHGKVIFWLFQTWNVCTCHNSTAAVPCVKSWSNHFITIWVRANWNIHKIWIANEKLLVKWVLEHKIKSEATIAKWNKIKGYYVT